MQNISILLKCTLFLFVFLQKHLPCLAQIQEWSGEGNPLPPGLKLPFHTLGLSLAEKVGTDPVGFIISIIQPRLIFIFSFGSFVVFISRDFCHLPSILQCA